MRRSTLWAVLLGVGLFCAATAVVDASTTTLTYIAEFSADDLIIDEAGDYETLRLPGAVTTVDIARPELPLKLIRFAVPDGTIAIDATARVQSQIELPGRHVVRPRQPEVPLSRLESVPFVEPDSEVYGATRPHPERACSLLDNGNVSGHGVATVAVYPVQYVPSDGRLLFNESIEITVTLSVAPAQKRAAGPRTARAGVLMADHVRRMVVNPRGVVEPVYAPGELRDDIVEYLLITAPSYASIYDPLIEWKTSKGVPAQTLTTTWIYENYDGVDQQEQIRNCIIDYYQNHGTIWVLLGGDTNVVPARVAWAMITGVGGSPDEDDIRCDLYYSDLDGTWNADGDAVWGEVVQDSVDMYADVFVGRSPAGSTSEATRFVQKVLTYEGAPGGETLPTDYQLNMLFLAEVLWTEPWSDGGICKNMIDDDSVPSRFDPITKLYQTNGQLTKPNTIAELNAGQNIINHNGHANWSVMSIGGSALYSSDFDNLTNGPRYGIWYSIGCWPAAIDYNSIGEHWVTSPTGGGIAFVGNSRYGWGSPGNPGGGTSDQFDREFFNQLFNEDVDQLGIVHANHRDEFVGLAKYNSYYRYCLYELLLLGDPEMRVWKDQPVEMAVAHPTEISLGEHAFVVTIARAGEPVDGARVCLANDELFVVGTTGPDGHVTLYPSPSAQGTCSISITGPGVLPYASSLDIVSTPPDSDPPGVVGTLVLADPFDIGGRITLDWTGYQAPSDFAYYNIYRETEDFDSVSSLTPLESGLLNAGVMDWDDTTVVNGQDYYYAVTVVDLCGNEDQSVIAEGPIAATNNARILVWDADDGDRPFDGVGDEFTTDDGTEVPWLLALDSIGELYTLSRSLPSDLSPFDFIIYLGGIVTFGGGGEVMLTDEEAIALTGFVDDGGHLYVEEPNFGKAFYVNGTPATIALWDRFHSVFALGSPGRTGNVQELHGGPGTVSEDMTFAYDYQGGPDEWVGKVSPSGEDGTFLVWSDQGTDGRGSLYVDDSTGSRRYMAPVLLGGMTDGPQPSTRLEYVTRILDELNLIGTTSVGEQVAGISHILGQNVPNPFNPSTTISYTVAGDGAHVELSVYNVAGRLIAQIENGEKPSGDHAARWDGKDATGAPASSGVYFYRLSVDGWSNTRKMVLLK